MKTSRLQHRAQRVTASIGVILAVTMLAGCLPAPRQSHEGYYRSGFEQSEFYPMGTSRPYWLEADGEVWDELYAFYQEAPGRGGGMTLHLIIEGDLDRGGPFGHLGAYDTRLTVTRILMAEPMSDDEFAAAIAGPH